MGKKRITEIVIEKHETLVIRQPCHAARPVCRECGGAETMVKPEEAAAIAGVSIRAVFRWVETATVHFDEAPDGTLYVCANSLPPSAGTKTLAGEDANP